MNVSTTGVVDSILDKLVKYGFARTKSEAVRYAVVRLGEELGLLDEDLMVKKKLDKIDSDISVGKRRVLTYEEALK